MAISDLHTQALAEWVRLGVYRKGRVSDSLLIFYVPLKPKVSADDDIGAKVKTPDTYQSNSSQAGIRESDPEEPTGSDDKNSLSMQEKTITQITKSDGHAFTTEAPRPGAALENVDKSTGLGLNEVLIAARQEGHEGLSNVAKRILKGEFGEPYAGDVPQW